MTDSTPRPPLPSGTRVRLYIAALEKLSDVTYEINEYVGRGSYRITCRETGVVTFAHFDGMRKIEVPVVTSDKQHSPDDAQSTHPVDTGLLAALTKDELTELSIRMLHGVTQSCKLAHYCRGDHALWTAAVGVSDWCFEVQQDTFATEFPAAS